MRILVLEPRARDQRIGFGQRLDDGVVRVAFISLVVDDALAFEAGGFFGEASVGVHSERNMRVDAALGERFAVRHPDVEVVAAVAGRGVHEAGAVFVGDMIAVEKRNLKVVTLSMQRMAACKTPKLVAGHILKARELLNLR